MNYQYQHQTMIITANFRYMRDMHANE